MPTPAVPNDWYQANQTALGNAIAQISQRLQNHGNAQETTALKPSVPSALPTWPATLQALCQMFQLSNFERDLLLLCAGMELAAEIAPLCGMAQGNPQRPYPTFSLALAALEGADWRSLAPNAPLRHWQLIQIGTGSSLVQSPLQIDEQILHYLTGQHYLHERLVGLGTLLGQGPVASSSTDSSTADSCAAAIAGAPPLVPSHQRLAEQLAQAWAVATTTAATDLLPILQLWGPELASQRAIAQSACAQLNLQPYAIAPELLDLGSLPQVQRLWEREHRLTGATLVVEWQDRSDGDRHPPGAIAPLIEQVRAPVILLGTSRRPQKHRPQFTFEVASPTTAEQRQLWHRALGTLAPHLENQIEPLVAHFNFTAPTIQAASFQLISQAPGLSSQPSPSQSSPSQSSPSQSSPSQSSPSPTSHPPAGSPQTTGPQLWQICRTLARPRLDELAQRIESTAVWQDLVLPELEKQVLQDLATQLHQRARVYEQWGFGGGSQRGLGISALFAGASGTGKTLAAEVLAQAIQLDLYRIDLSAVVSKYIGETEKNLGRVFDAAEVGGVILLFDEADALFGKRSDVKDSHDRYANMEVSYLLQRMEAYRGLAILTTNLKSAIDQAFLRRIRFIVQFPFPDASQRAEIWQRVFPPQAPTEDLDPIKLAKLNLAGGNIRNIALNAAFIAAEANQPIRMGHILQAARSEYTKLERPLTETEIKGWI